MNREAPAVPVSTWLAVALAAPAIAFWLALAINAMAESLRLRTGCIEGVVTSGAFWGGLLNLIATPAQFLHVLGVQRHASPGARAWLFGLLLVGVSAAISVLRYLVGLSDLS